jgi:hypothetical protein
VSLVTNLDLVCVVHRLSSVGEIPTWNELAPCIVRDPSPLASALSDVVFVSRVSAIRRGCLRLRPMVWIHQHIE